MKRVDTCAVMYELVVDNILRKKETQSPSLCVLLLLSIVL